MTTRKFRRPKIKATEETVFGFRAASGGRRMMANSDDNKDETQDIINDVDDNIDETINIITLRDLRLMIKEQLN
jgi:hypothetical protein